MLFLHYIPKKKAKEFGLKRFFTFKPCSFGNLSERHTSSGKCLCADCAEYIRLKTADWHRRNSSSVAARKKIQKSIDPDYQRRYYLANKEKVSARCRINYELNPERHFEKAKRRVVSKMNRTPPWYGELDEFAVIEIKSLCWYRERATGIKWNIDHMIPMQAKTASGLHCWQNFQVIPEFHNKSKRNRMILTKPDEWLSAM